MKDSLKNNKGLHVVFYGPEGSGKGTQAKLLGEKLNLPILTSGDLVREAAINDKGLIGEACRRALDEGKYAPDSEMFVLWKNKLKEVKDGWIVDGFPRNLRQAKFLQGKIAKYGYKIDKLIYLKINFAESMKRLLKRKRPLRPGSNVLHDSPERIRQRLEMYYQSEKEVLKFFRELGVIEEINGKQPIEKVHQEIMAKINR